MKFFDHLPEQEKIQLELDRRMQAVMQHGQFINGPEVKEVEQKLAEYVGVKHAVACANGTDALELSLMALGLQPGDEVITTSYSYFATAEAIERCGLKPVFVDIDPKTYTIDPAKIEEKITPKTKAILPVSLFGQCADFNAINTIAKKHNLPVIEDGAQSFGATHKGRKSLSLATIGCTSFFPTKPLGCGGDGGACFTNDDALAEKIRQRANHGQKNGVMHLHHESGMNSRLDTLQAAILLAKLPELDRTLDERRAIAKRYDEAFAGNKLITTPHVAEGNQSVYAQYIIQVPYRGKVQEELTKKGIPTAVYYPCIMPLQPALGEFPKRLVKDGDPWPAAKEAATLTLALPLYAGLSIEDQNKIIAEVKTAVETVDKRMAHMRDSRPKGEITP